jgi:hydrogenase nickel incorporation protein HypA/HybF
VHELSIALSILEIGSEQAEELGAPILAVHLRLGQLSGVVAEALRSAYDLAREDSPLARAELLIEEVPVVVRCEHCRVETEVDFPHLLCGVCGAPTAEVVRGRELEIVGMEIEE